MCARQVNCAQWTDHAQPTNHAGHVVIVVVVVVIEDSIDREIARDTGFLFIPIDRYDVITMAG